MKAYTSIFISLILFIILPFFYCADSPDNVFNQSIELFRENKPGALKKIERSLVEKISAKSFKSKNLSSNRNAIYYMNDNEIELVYPSEISLAKQYIDINKKIFYLNKKYFVAGRGNLLSIFDTKGSLKKTFETGKNKKKIKSIILMGDEIIYYKNKRLYKYKISKNSNKLLFNDTFSPPYSKYFNVNFYRSGNILGIVAGIAGSYNLSIINIKKNSIILKNTKISSSKIYFNAGHIYAITGSTAKWKLVKIIISNKRMIKIHSFKDMYDLELTSFGYLFENSKGIWAAPYSGKKILLPFKYKLAGKYNDFVLLQYKYHTYVADMKKLFDSIEILKNKTPEIF